MLILTGVLFGVSVACTAWLVIYRQQQQKLVAARLANAGGSTAVQLPYELQSMLNPYKGETLGADKAEKNSLLKDLFLGGMRTQANVKFFTFLIRLSFVLPVIMILIYALTDKLTLRNFFISLFMGVVFFIYVRVTARILKQRRQRQIMRTLPQFLDLIVVCVEAGLSFMASLERILREFDRKEPLNVEFKAMYNEFLNGLPLSQACQRMDQRCGVQDLSMLLSTIVQSDQIGAELGSSLRTQAAELRDKLKQRIRGRAQQIPVKILFPVVLIFSAFTVLNLSYVGFQMTTAVREIKAKGKQAQSPRSF